MFLPYIFKLVFHCLSYRLAADIRMIGCHKWNNIFNSLGVWLWTLTFCMENTFTYFKLFYVLCLCFNSPKQIITFSAFNTKVIIFLARLMGMFFWYDQGMHYRMVSSREYLLVYNKYHFQVRWLRVRLFFRYMYTYMYTYIGVLYIYNCFPTR